MKKIFIYLLIFATIIIIIPALCTKKNVNAMENENSSSTSELNDVGENYTYKYSKYAKIKLYHSKTGETEELPIDEYLYGTVSAEMPVNYEIEALKAQAIVARTYTIYQIMNNNKHGDADICDSSTCCQAWIAKDDRMAKWEENESEENWNKIVKAVNETSGKIIVYDGKPINAFFHSNSGGKTENVSNVWGGKNLPYLQSVETSGEDEYKQYNSEAKFSKNELLSKLKEKYSDIEIDFDKEDCIKIMEHTESGRVKNIKFGNKELAGTEARTILGLRSTNFSFEICENEIIFYVIGYGHGVGMSQTGADSLAKTGYSCYDIIKHFYTGVEIVMCEQTNM